MDCHEQIKEYIRAVVGYKLSGPIGSTPVFVRYENGRVKAVGPSRESVEVK